MPTWTCRVRHSGKKYTLTASSESEAVRLLIVGYRIGPRDIESLEKEECRNNTDFVVTVGSRDYTVPASDELDALHILGLRGIDTSKARNVRRR